MTAEAVKKNSCGSDLPPGFVHELDGELVKAYAVDFRGTKTLRDAGSEQVENFVAHLSDWAEKDSNSLLCQLNSYAEPDGLLALDPRLLCYSWITGISEVAQIVFVRKRLVEIQYLHTTITDEQRREFSDIVHETIQQIEDARFLPHSGIRFPLNPCSTCPYVGLCLGKTSVVDGTLIRKPGAQDFGVFDELTY